MSEIENGIEGLTYVYNQISLNRQSEELGEVSKEITGMVKSGIADFQYNFPNIIIQPELEVCIEKNLANPLIMPILLLQNNALRDRPYHNIRHVITVMIAATVFTYNRLNSLEDDQLVNFSQKEKKYQDLCLKAMIIGAWHDSGFMINGQKDHEINGANLFSEVLKSNNVEIQEYLIENEIDENKIADFINEIIDPIKGTFMDIDKMEARGLQYSDELKNILVIASALADTKNVIHEEWSSEQLRDLLPLEFANSSLNGRESKEKLEEIMAKENRKIIPGDLKLLFNWLYWVDKFEMYFGSKIAVDEIKERLEKRLRGLFKAGYEFEPDDSHSKIDILLNNISIFKNDENIDKRFSPDVEEFIYLKEIIHRVKEDMIEKGKSRANTQPV